MEEMLIFLVKVLAGILGLYFMISYMRNPKKEIGNIQSRWQHSFDSMDVSPNQFYDAVEKCVLSKQLTGLGIYLVSYSTRGLLSSSRYYLQITREDKVFLVCAAPFGTGFFVSWWYGEKVNHWMDFLLRIPKWGPAIVERMSRKTFYEMDTESMFLGCVKDCVQEVIAEITSTQGKRGLTELERQPSNTQSSSRFF